MLTLAGCGGGGGLVGSNGEPADGQAPGGGEEVGGSCTDTGTGICSEITGGNVAGFQESCGVDGLWSNGPCALPSVSYTCLDFQGTSNIDGSPMVINIFYPQDFCTRYPSVDNKSTCENNAGGIGSGTPCPPP